MTAVEQHPYVDLEADGETHRIPLVPKQSVHVLMGRIISELPAIGKNQRNSQQGYAFRGIDDVLDALSPLLGKYGVFVLPEVIDRVTETRTTGANKPLYTVHLHVRYRVFGPAGDCVEGSAWGEGTDSGDKATSKAMTMAFKYFVFEAFAVATEEQRQADNDRHTAPDTVFEPKHRMNDRDYAQFIAFATTKGVSVAKLPELVMEVMDGESDDVRDVPPGDRFEELKTKIRKFNDSGAPSEGSDGSQQEPHDVEDHPPAGALPELSSQDDSQTNTTTELEKGKVQRLVIALKPFGFTDDERHHWASDLLDKRVESFKHLSDDEYRLLVKHAEKGPQRQQPPRRKDVD